MKKNLITLFLIAFGFLSNAQKTNVLATAKIFSVKDMYGLKDKNGKIIVAAIYGDMQLKSNYALAIKGTNISNITTTLFDSTGKAVAQYSNISVMDCGVAKITKSKSIDEGVDGLIDLTGKILVPLGKYDNIKDCSEGLIQVEKNKKYGLIDLTGKVIVEPFYTLIRNPSDGMILVVDGILYGYLNMKGEVAINPQYPKAYDFSNGTAKVCYDINCTDSYTIDKTGKKVSR